MEDSAVKPNIIPGRRGFSLKNNRCAHLLSVGWLLCAGCKSAGVIHYQTAAPSEGRDSVNSQRLNDEGLKDIAKGDWEGAERKFKRALDHDLYYSPAHNNLGLALMQQKRYYEAAWEFESAGKLAPTAVEPRINLGRLYEATGRMDAAIEQYESASKLAPQDGVPMRHLARAYVKAGHTDDRLKTALERILLIQGEPHWDTWARGQLVRLGRDDDTRNQAFPPPAEESK
jgi:Flp pilus assembly protein TadD